MSQRNPPHGHRVACICPSHERYRTSQAKDAVQVAQQAGVYLASRSRLLSEFGECGCLA